MRDGAPGWLAWLFALLAGLFRGRTPEPAPPPAPPAPPPAPVPTPAPAPPAPGPTPPPAPAPGPAPPPEPKPPTPAPVPPPSPTPIPSLAGWKLTLPTGPRESPAEVLTAGLLAGFEQRPHFWRRPDGALLFRAPVNGVTTSGSDNPRSELREMSGTQKARWSTSLGKHTMRQIMSFDRLPDGNDGCGLVGGQIHDARNDVSVFRLEGRRLWVTKGNSKHTLVTEAYELGTRIETKFVCSGGLISAFVNGRLVVTLDAQVSGCYFKAGAYTQINAGLGKHPRDASNYGQVTIYELYVSHV